MQDKTEKSMQVFLNPYQFQIDTGRAYEWISSVGSLRWMVANQSWWWWIIFRRAQCLYLHLMHVSLLMQHVYSSNMINIVDTRRYHQ